MVLFIVNASILKLTYTSDNIFTWFINQLLLRNPFEIWGLTGTAHGQNKHNLSCKPSNTSSGTSLTLISSPRKSSQFVISDNSSG